MIVLIEHIGAFPLAIHAEAWEADEDYACGSPAYLYAIGKLPPRYPVPALACTSMAVCLAHYKRNYDMLAWDNIWQEGGMLDLLHF